MNWFKKRKKQPDCFIPKIDTGITFLHEKYSTLLDILEMEIFGKKINDKDTFAPRFYLMYFIPIVSIWTTIIAKDSGVTIDSDKFIDELMARKMDKHFDCDCSFCTLVNCLNSSSTFREFQRELRKELGKADESYP